VSANFGTDPTDVTGEAQVMRDEPKGQWDELDLPPQMLDPALLFSHRFRHILDEKDRFCMRLELFADLLPDGIDARDCLLIAQNVVPLIYRAHDFEERVIFSSLLAESDVSAELEQAIERLRFEHICDEEFANDLCLSLREFVMDRRHANVEALAWMLRGFFEGIRRHIAFERDYILPLVEKWRL
jgi:hypothetical protein